MPHRTTTQGSGTQAPSICAGGEGGETLGVRLRCDVDLAAVFCGAQTLLFEPVAEGDVLGVAQLRSRERLPVEVLWTGDVRGHHQCRTAGCGPGDHAHCVALGLDIGVDRGVRPDVGDVQRAGKQGCHGVRAGVEDRWESR